jgi:Mg-chelatase subunit ChlD
MRKIQILPVIALLIFSCTSNSQEVNNQPNSVLDTLETATIPPETVGRAVEIVFCLDATGSMSGLIETAKEKIWSIVSEMAQSSEVTHLKLGMVFYRDRGDKYITKPISLTTDLDSVYTEFLAIKADGGGDTPESVNQALNEAVSNMDWSEGSTTYKTIFVIGDCPPHMDYANDVKYSVSCKKAAGMGIRINTIKLGNSCTGAIEHFQAMSECSNGEFLQLDQNAKDYIVSTPYDKEINEVSMQIDDSRMYYGSKEEQRVNYTKKENSMQVYIDGSVTSNSDRVAYKSSKAGKNAWMGEKEMVDDYSKNKVKVEELKEDQLPQELKGKSTEEKKQLIEKIQSERTVNNSKLTDLNKKRRDYIAKENKSRGKESSFSKEVVEIMEEQAKGNKGSK